MYEATHRTRAHNTVLDLTNCRLRVLAKELGDAWYGLANNLGYAPSTNRRISVVVRKFLEFAEGQLSPGVSVNDDESALVECIHAWEVSLLSEYSTSSNLPYKDSQQLSIVLRWLLQSGHRLGPLVGAWAEAPPLALSKKETPVDELPNKSRLQLRDACRQIIRQAEARVRRGREMATAGSGGLKDDSGMGGLLWTLLNGDEYGSPAFDLVRDHRSAPQELLDEIGWSASESNPGTFRIVARRHLAFLLSPTPRELQAFRVLLLMETGWAPEQLTDLRLKDIALGDERVSLTTTKNRGRGLKLYDYRKGASNWSVWALLDRLMRLCEHLRHLGDVAREDQYLFARLSRSGRGRIFTNDVFKDYLLKDLVLETGIEWSGAYDIRRLRKTFKTIQGAITGTAAGAAGTDHTVQVSRDHYMQTTTVHFMAAKAVNTAQKFVYDRVTLGPTVVAAQAEDIRGTGKEAQILEKALETTAESAKDIEMGVTACRDPYDSPFTASGKLCHLRPSSCFLCPNALVFLDHLPRIMAFRNTVVAQEPNFTPTEFQAVWGAALASIDAIMGEFSPEQLEQASLALPGSVHIPISQRIQLS